MATWYPEQNRQAVNKLPSLGDSKTRMDEKELATDIMDADQDGVVLRLAKRSD